MHEQCTTCNAYHAIHIYIYMYILTSDDGSIDFVIAWYVGLFAESVQGGRVILVCAVLTCRSTWMLSDTLCLQSSNSFRKMITSFSVDPALRRIYCLKAAAHMPGAANVCCASGSAFPKQLQACQYRVGFC